MFRPHNNLERAIYNREIDRVVYAICEKEKLTNLKPLYLLDEACFPEEVALAVIFYGTDKKQRNSITDGWFWGTLKKGSRLYHLAESASGCILPVRPPEKENRLIAAIAAADSAEVIRLIREEAIRMTRFVPELLTMLPELSREAALTLLRDGLEPKIKARVFGKLLQEHPNPKFITNHPYRMLIMYVNLMIRVMAQEEISASEPWYPETA